VTTSFGAEEINVPKDMDLPKAAHSQAASPSLIIQVRSNKIFINEKVISMNNLIESLRGERKTHQAILIEADKKTKFSDLNPVVLSGLNAGFTDIKFAVLQADEV
jgi:biopolymer transport protein ExbD